MQLDRRGVKFVHPDPRLVSLAPDGRALVFSRDPGRTADAIRPFSAKDAKRYTEFCATLGRVGGFLADLLEMTPPSIDAPSAGEVWELLKAGRKFRALGKKESFALLRWGPMAVADLVAEWFETDLLQASVAARAIHGTAMGPWSAGTGAVLLLGAARRSAPRRKQRLGGGRPGRRDARDGRGRARGGRGDPHRRRRAANPREGRPGDGRRPRRRRRDPGGHGRLRCRSAPHVSAPDRSGGARAGFHDADQKLPVPRHGREAQLRVARAAGVSRRRREIPRPRSRGRVHIGPGIDYLERAFDASKYGETSAAPYLDVAFPSIADPSMAPAGRHVMSVHMQYAPFTLRTGSWNGRGGPLSDLVLRTLEPYAPGLTALVENGQVITPLDLEQVYGLTGGHIHHGELALDQLFTMRPTLGWADYRTPLGGLYLCGSGTHPGNGLTGASGQNAAREILKGARARS